MCDVHFDVLSDIKANDYKLVLQKQILYGPVSVENYQSEMN